MTDRRIDERKQGPLSSGELEQDRMQAGQDGDLGEQLASDESDEAGNCGGHGVERGPNPIAGTMLPPD